ncbi:MAG: TonB-dependent receptor plug domain-containing protein [Brumimicrobium sp.]|nr:TonB-dependent receptor plug domain-containing protein [Brumimicrobium sp.]
MKKKMLTAMIALFSLTTVAQGNFGEIVGKIFERSETEVPAEFAKVWVQQGNSKFGAEVDSEGRFRIVSVPTGRYILKASYLTDTLSEVIVANVMTDGIANVGRINILDRVKIEDEVVVTHFIDPLINFGDTGLKRISAEDIMQSAVRTNPKELIASRNSEIKLSENGDIMIRGARANDMCYFVDGVKTGEINPLPSVAIGGVTIYTSAIPAKYGDTTGGVIIMETKSYYDLWREWKLRTATN